MSSKLNPSLSRALCALALSASAAVAGDAHTTPTLNIHKLGDPIPGYDGVVGFAPNAVRMGPGGWVIAAQVAPFDAVTTSEAGLGPYSEQVLAGGEVVDLLFIHMDVGPSGRVARIGSVLPSAQAVILDDKAVLKTGAFAGVPGVPANHKWREFHSLGFDAAGRLTLCARTWLDGFSTTLRTVFVRYHVNASGELSAPQLLLQSGDSVAGQTVTSLPVAIDTYFGVTDAGAIAANVGLTGPEPGATEVKALVLGDSIVALDGAPSVLPGRDWILQGGDPIAVNGQGDVAFRTRVVGGAFPEFELVVLVKNGAVLALQDTPVPGFPGSSLTSVTEPRLADDGRLAWGARFDDAQGHERQALFVDDELFVINVGASGDVSQATQIDGTWLSSIGLFQQDWDFEDDGDRLLFRGSNNVSGAWGIYTVDTRPWVSQGGGLVGAGPAAPLLVGGGDLAPGQPASLTTSGAPAFASAGLVLGLSELGLPFKGGTLCPNPDVLLTGLTTDGAGQLALAGTWPGGVPAGVPFWSQVWVADGAGPAGFAATNCLRAVTP